jgi:hypothetical protein
VTTRARSIDAQTDFDVMQQRRKAALYYGRGERDGGGEWRGYHVRESAPA